MQDEIISHNEDETIRAGIEFARRLKPMDVVFLHGNLGSGKTTFTKGIVKGLSGTSRVISPTFVVLRTHSVKVNEINKLYHLDLYRLSGEEDAKAIDMKDFLDDPQGVVVIEWPDIGQNLVSKKVWHISLEPTGDEGRKIIIRYI